MGHPDNYTESSPKGYKEGFTWESVEENYTEEEKKKILKENYEKGGKLSLKSAHDKEVKDHPKPPPGPEQHKNVIKKCDTKDCDLSEEKLISKLEGKKAKPDKPKLKKDNPEKYDKASLILFNEHNQDKLFEFINSPQINSLAFRGHQHGQ